MKDPAKTCLMIFLGLLGFLTLPWLLMCVVLFLLPGPPKPVIRHGEFPFVVEYDLNGQHKVLRDTLICDFAGYDVNEGNGKTRKWKSRLASGNKKVTLLKIDEIYQVIIDPGEPEFYMGDQSPYRSYDDNSKVSVGVFGRSKNGECGLDLSEDDIEKMYHVKVTHWKPSKPITNTFK